MNQHDLVHKWAHGLNDATSGGAVYATGGVLYSYGMHFPLGVRCGQKDGKPRFLLNSRSYSITTTKHQGWAASATHHGERLCVPMFDSPGSYGFHRTAEVLEANFKAAALATLSRGPRKREDAQATCADIVRKAKLLPEFVKGCGVTLDKPTRAILRRLASADVSNAAEAAAKVAQRAKAAALRAEAKRRKDEAKALAQWIAGADVRRNFSTLALRLTDDGRTVQTSHGASVSAAAARLLWSNWGKLSLVGRSIDGYRVNEARADALVIGCHTIDHATAADLATRAGW